MLQQRMLFNKKTTSKTPYTINKQTVISNATLGLGSSSSGGINYPTGATSGEIVFTTSASTSNTSGTAAGFYRILDSNNTSLGQAMGFQKLASGSGRLPSVSTGWGTANNGQNRFEAFGQITYRVDNMVINGVLPTTTKQTETFVQNYSIGTSNPILITPTNYAGGTLFIVTIVTQYIVDITVSGGEGTGSIKSNASRVSPLIVDNNWSMVTTPNSISNLSMITVAYYRSGSVTSSSANPISIVVDGAPTSANVGISVSTFTTSDYDTGPIGPIPTPSPSPSQVTPTPTPTVSFSPTPTPSISVTPTGTPPPGSPTPTPSVTPSAPGAGDTGWIGATQWMAGAGTGNPDGLLALDGDYATISVASFASTQVAYKADGLATQLANATTLIGVEIRVTGYLSTNPTVAQIGPSNGTAGGGATNMNLTTSVQTKTYGGPTDVFGYNAADLLTRLQSPNSGVEIYLWAPFSTAMVGYFDYIEIRAYYS